MASERELKLVVTGDAKGLSKAFSSVNKDASRMERGLGGMRRGLVGLTKTAAAAGVALVGAGAAFATFGAKGAIADERVMARSENVIKKMGATSWTSAEQVRDLGQSLQDTTGTSNDLVQAGANIVLTFGNIRNEAGKGNDVFDRTVGLANDMSVALGSDMQSSSIQLGKALNDPIYGLTQLRRVGVSFTEQQQEQVKAMVASGDTMGAQKLMLAELEKQFGGAASSEGPVTEAWQRLTATFTDAAKAVMVGVLPALANLADFATNNLVPRITSMAAVITPVIQGIATSIGGMTQQVLTVVRGAWPQISQVAQTVFGAVAGFVRGAVDTVVALWPRIIDTVRAVVENVGPIIADLGRLFMAIVDRIKPLVPDVRRILEGFASLVAAIANRIGQLWDKFGEDIMAVVERVFSALAPIARPLLATLAAAIETITAIINGDWSKAWEGIKSILANALKALVAAIRGVGGLVLSAMQFVAGKALDGLKALPGKMAQAGKDIVQGIIDGIRAAPNAIIDAILALIPSPTDIVARAFGGGSTTAAPIGAGGFTGLPAGANGLMLPGTYRGVDTMLIAAAPGEAVLTPRQQALADSGMPIRQALSTTGAAFAAGGYVRDAYGRATAQLGKPYGGAGQQRTGPDRWDCSGYATYVAGVNVGGSTATAYPSSSPRRGGELIAWGFRKSHGGGYRGGYDEHMGVFVNGRWFDAGSGGVESNADSARWQEVRIPRGLEGLTVQAVGGVGNPEDPEGNDPGTNTRGRGTPQPLNDRQKLANLLGKATGRSGLGQGQSISKWALPLVNALSSDVPDLSGSTPGASATGAQSRQVSAAGRSARAAARRSGLSPAEVREAGEQAEREAELKVLRRNRRAAIQLRAKLRKHKKRFLADWTKISRKPVRGAKAVAARRRAVAQIKAKLREFTAEINDLTEIIAEVNERMAELNEAAIEEQHQANYDDATGTGGPAEEPDPGPSVWDQLNAEAAMAALTDDPADDITVAEKMRDQARRDYEQALATGDSRLIGPAAQNYRSAMDRLAGMKPTPEPGPSVADYLNLAATIAEGTEGTEDDIAVARQFERIREQELAEAMKTNDPRQINAALQSLMAIRQQITALQDNTDALGDNTDALKGFAGSVTFGFRGQEYVLRNLAPPSSDRIENLLVGA